VEGRSYTAANRLFLYVNRASLNKTGLKDLLSFMISDQAAATLQSLSFTPPTAQAYDTDKQVLAGSAEGRQFSREVTGFTIPATLAGNVNIDGAADGYDYLKQVSDALTAKYANAKATYKMEGESAGLRRLCNGETDLAVAYNDLSADQAAKCAANNIPTTTINLGAHAVVLLANAKSPYLACLTTAQIGTAWSAVSGGSVTSWAKVSDKFPDVKMTLFAPADGDGYSDLLLAKAAGRPATIRADAAETNSDPLYRAAATANVEGALTLMSWTDYQKVLNNDQANIQLVGVDAGKGCVVPSADTIKNGSYPLTRTTKLIVSLPSLARSEVQSLLWFAMSDDNYKLLEDSGFLGISFGDLPVLRDTLQKDFDQAQIAATAKAEATPEATPEATSTPAP
jgi:phosphate transport system substrate-binding protein